MLSHQDWEDGLEELANEISSRRDVDTSGVYYTASYDSPWVAEYKRRNEVWIMRREGNTDDQNNSQFISNFGGGTRNSNNNFKTADELREIIDHTVIETGSVSEIVYKKRDSVHKVKIPLSTFPGL
jgi:hypothetical protein